MNYSVAKAAGYVLVHTPDMILHNGTTQTTEKIINPESEYLKQVPEHIRSYEDVVNYAPNQTYIGNMTPEELRGIDLPWFDKKLDNADRYGRFGEIMPQVEFLGLLKMSDAFDLVLLEPNIVGDIREKLSAHKCFTDEDVARIKDGVDISEIEKHINENHAEALYNEGKLVGCVKRAHDIDPNLNAHIMFENLVVKASGVLAFKHLIMSNDIDPASIEYIIECSEEACGDMNQRGGGNFAKSIAELGGAVNATGSDTRGFCAAPTHALIQAAALVKAGVYENVVIVAGGNC